MEMHTDYVGKYYLGSDIQNHSPHIWLYITIYRVAENDNETTQSCI